MAKSRSLPTDLLADPDYMELDSDTQVILLMLVLMADDEGRGRAHTGMLSRHLNKSPEQIEHALACLSELDLVACYVVGRHRYYHLLRWWEWQTLSKPTPSRFPAPPTAVQSEWVSPRDVPRIPQGSPGESWAEGEGEGKGKGREQNREEKAEEEGALPAGITRFPQPTPFSEHISGASRLSPPPPGAKNFSPPEAHGASIPPIQQVAKILQLPVTEALTHVVTAYAPFGSLPLLSEANAAREWIDDTTRNRSHKPMTVAFFHRWLKREQERQAERPATQASQTSHVRTTATSGARVERYTTQQRDEGPRLPSLMHLAEEDRRLEEAIRARKAGR
jgi:DNA-binding transcriptional ArsR family regulator